MVHENIFSHGVLDLKHGASHSMFVEKIELKNKVKGLKSSSLASEMLRKSASGSDPAEATDATSSLPASADSETNSEIDLEILSVHHREWFASTEDQVTSSVLSQYYLSTSSVLTQY